MFRYKKVFVLKNARKRQSVNFLLYKKQINTAESIYNTTCMNSLNKKQITVTIFKNHLEFDIISHNQLNSKYMGLSLKLFSQILVERCGFLSLCTTSDPRKLFVSA